QVFALGGGQVRVSQDLAHSERGRVADQVRPVSEHLGVIADGQVEPGTPGRVAAHPHAADRLDRNDAGHSRSNTGSSAQVQFGCKGGPCTSLNRTVWLLPSES